MSINSFQNLCSNCWIHEIIDKDKNDIIPIGIYITKSRGPIPNIANVADLHNINLDDPSNDKIVGISINYIDMDEKSVDISWIGTNSKYAGQKQSLVMMGWLCKIIKEQYPQITEVHLDDATDISHPKNIYYKLGFMVKNLNDEWVSWDQWIYLNSISDNPQDNPFAERMIFVDTLIYNIAKILK